MAKKAKMPTDLNQRAEAIVNCLTDRVDCIFCAVQGGLKRAVVLYEDSATCAVLDIGAATRGHTLVIPRNHVADFWDLSAEDGTAVMATAQHVAKLLRSALHPPGLNLVNSTGAVAGQDVFHFHLHLVPRYPDDGLTPLWKPTNPSWDELEELAVAIRVANSN